MIEFVVASHDESILKENIFKSDIYYKNYRFTIMRGYNNVSKAYNDAKELLSGDIVIYLHHDLLLPVTFEHELLTALKYIDDNFGVLGIAGVNYNSHRTIHGYLNDRGRIWGSPYNLPAEVQTLDEVLLITHGDIVFDEYLSTDFYGADICLTATTQGRKNYAINAFCHHNSNRVVGGRTESFYKCQEYFKEKWKDYLPVATTCSILEK